MPALKMRGLRTPTRTLADIEESGKLEAIAIDDLKFDSAYQRDVSVQMVQDMAENWDMAVAGAIVVNERSPGEFYVIDGQHRCAAAKLTGETHILAQVLSNLSRPEEAEMRLKGNVRRGDTAMERFRAQLAAGNPESLAIAELCDRFGTHINATPNLGSGINTVSSVEALYRVDNGVLLAETFDFIRRTFGDVSGEHATVPIIKGVAWMIQKHRDDADLGRLADRLRTEGVASMLRKARDYQVVHRGSLWLNWYRSAVEVYNHKLPQGSTLQWRSGGWSSNKGDTHWSD